MNSLYSKSVKPVVNMDNLDGATVIYTIIPLVLSIVGLACGIYYLHMTFSDSRERKKEIKRLNHELEKSKLINRKLKEFVDTLEKKEK